MQVLRNRKIMFGSICYALAVRYYYLLYFLEHFRR
jgi:hypothetical protein